MARFSAETVRLAKQELDESLEDNTPHSLWGRCASACFARSFGRGAGILPYCKELPGDMAEYSSADAAQSCQACFAVCCP